MKTVRYTTVDGQRFILRYEHVEEAIGAIWDWLNDPRLRLSWTEACGIARRVGASLYSLPIPKGGSA